MLNGHARRRRALCSGDSTIMLRYLRERETWSHEGVQAKCLNPMGELFRLDLAKVRNTEMDTEMHRLEQRIPCSSNKPLPPKVGPQAKVWKCFSQDVRHLEGEASPVLFR